MWRKRQWAICDGNWTNCGDKGWRPHRKAERSNTPARSNRLPNNSTYTTLKARDGDFSVDFATPGKPVIRAEVVSSPVSSLRDIDEDMISENAGEVEDQPEENATPRSRSTSPSIPPSLSYTGLKEMLRPLAPPKTPSFVGMKEMFAPARPQTTPDYTGLREMLKPEATVATPSFEGLKEMFRPDVVPSTPDFDGSDRMLQVPVEQEAIGEVGLDAFDGEGSIEVDEPATVTGEAARTSRNRKATTASRPEATEQGLQRITNRFGTARSGVSASKARRRSRSCHWRGDGPHGRGDGRRNIRGPVKINKIPLEARRV